jgi:hypothetical protein
MSKVKFKEDTHQYLSDKGELISVSSLVKKYEKEKDWYKIAIAYCKKLKKTKGINKTVKEVMAEWAKKKKLGSEAGTIVHEIKETDRLGYSSNVKHYGFKGEGKESFPLQELEDGWIYPELMAYDFDFMVCGQSDEVEIVNNTINILDYKTDKEIVFKAYSSEWQESEKLLPPLQHLENCNANIYSLKMSLYMYIIWKANNGRFKPGKITLRWCPLERDEDGIPILYDGRPKILFEKDIEVPYRKKEVIALLEHYKKSK